MNYKAIIQELKEGGDRNVLAFLRDIEKMKPMSKKDRDHCLQTRFMPESVTKLVEEFIPFIIMVAYGNVGKVKTLTVLDLINEGILGAYAAFSNSCKDGVLYRRRVLNSIKSYIYKAIRTDSNQCIADYSFDVCVPEGPMNDEGMILECDRDNVRGILMEAIEESLGARDAAIVYDYYFGKIFDYDLISEKYGLSKERCRQVLAKVKTMSYTELKELKANL